MKIDFGRFIGVYFFCVTVLLFTSSFAFAQAGAQRIILLRHSTGGNLFEQGKVVAWFQNYNAKNGTSYNISMRAYPDTPYPWNNYPYDYWNLWINPKGPAKAGSSGIDTLENLAKNYDVIVWKHCFPGADLQADTGSPSASSSVKNLGNYKLQYRALRAKFDTLPDTIFIVWTLAPRHRLNTTSAQAARARQFVDWVKNGWLTEDGKKHPNIFIFDFWGQMAEDRATPSAGGVMNTLRYAYELSHSSNDSHPNTLANQTVGPIFAQRVVEVIQSFHSQAGTAGNDTAGDDATGSDNNTATAIAPPTNLRIVIE